MLVLLGEIFPAFAADTKTVRLRNETITTAPAQKAAIAPNARVAEPRASGLFLVQFSGVLQPAWREQLRGMGVVLLRFVPDDTFIARFDQASVAQVRALPFVHWVGEYRATHKVHEPIRRTAALQPAHGETSIRVLLAPDAGASERLLVRRGMARVQRESTHRFGTA